MTARHSDLKGKTRFLKKPSFPLKHPLSPKKYFNN